MDSIMETITILVISETLMEKSADGTLYEIDNKNQYIGYRDNYDLDEHLENEWSKTIYDGVFDNDYDDWFFVAHTDSYDEDDVYKGFERIFKTEDGREVIYKVLVEPAILVG